MKKPKIVYYTTPYGYGHVTRANAICEKIGDRAEIHLISAVDTLFDFAKNITNHRIIETLGMPRIDIPIYYQDPQGRTDDVNSGKYMPDYRQHFRDFVDIICKIDPALVIVDITPEFAVYAKLLGYKTAQMLITGKRDDLRNKISYSSADHIIVPYPKGFTDVSYWPEDVRKKMYWSGAFSRFDGDAVIKQDDAKSKLNVPLDKKLIVCAFGRGDLGDVVLRKVREMSQSAELSNLEFRMLGNVSNVEDYLAAADCVISGAGDNTVNENCYFRIPMILIPLIRRYDEQTNKASALEKMGAARVISEKEVVAGKLKAELLDLINDSDFAEKTKKAQALFVDGHGAERLANQILQWAK